ncbi:hypothetical protein COBT_003810, partial [Conglomerata obtusa]
EDQTQARIDMIICKLLREQNTNCRIVKVYRGDKLLGVVGDNVIKPNILFLKNNTEIVCNHEYDKGHYREYYFNYNCCRKNIEKIKEGICKNSDDDINIRNSANELNNNDGLIEKKHQHYLAYEIIENEEKMNKIHEYIE